MPAMRTILPLILINALAEGFHAPRLTLRTLHPATSTALFAKAGKGFGKAREQTEAKPKALIDSSISSPSAPVTQEKAFLKSVEVGGFDEIPTEQQNLPPEERTKLILREKYGLKPLAEQEADAKQQDALAERRKKQEKWKKKSETAQPEFDIMTALPAPVLLGIDRFLKGGVVVCGTLFITAGLFITVEAWSKTSGQPLPADLDSFIVTIVEPNFTPGLLVLLSFSVGLGLFAAAQLGSSGASYKED